MEMKKTLLCLLWINLIPVIGMAQPNTKTKAESETAPVQLYMDIHHFLPGKVSIEDVVAAHAKDLAIQEKYGVQFIQYWVDTERGDVYCLSSSSSPEAVTKTHAEAHGLLPDEVLPVTDGVASRIIGCEKLYLDIHELGAGNVTADAVARAHDRDLAVQEKYGVNFINYWVNEKKGIVICLSEAPGSEAVIATHREAHGLIPKSVSEVKQGQ
jgi:hypothetical protein